MLREQWQLYCSRRYKSFCDGRLFFWPLLSHARMTSSHPLGPIFRAISRSLSLAHTKCLRTSRRGDGFWEIPMSSRATFPYTVRSVLTMKCDSYGACRSRKLALDYMLCLVFPNPVRLLIVMCAGECLGLPQPSTVCSIVYGFTGWLRITGSKKQR